MNLGRFSGDGRVKITPIMEQPKGAVSKGLTRSQCLKIIDSLSATKVHYSRSGHTLWVVTEFYDLNNIPYTVKEVEHGWVVERAMQ